MTSVHFNSFHEIPDQPIKPSSSSSWVSLAKLFVTDLLAPPVEMCQKAIEQIKQDGALGIMRRIGRALQNHPSDAIVIAGSLALGYDPSIAEKSMLIPTILGTTAAVRNSQVLIEIAKSNDGKTLIEKGVRWTCYAIVIYSVSSVPVSAAYEWNSLADAKEAYSGELCKGPLQEIVEQVRQCLINGNKVEDCHALIPEGFDFDHQTFTHHSSGAISTVDIRKNGQICFLTAPDHSKPVTKTCFLKITDPSSRTVESLPTMTLTRAQEGMEPGDSALHVAAHRIPSDAEIMLRQVNAISRLYGLNTDTPLPPLSCGGFHPTRETTHLDNKAICLLTALEPQGPVTQTCYNPTNPYQVVVKTITGIELDFQPDGKPVSLVIKNPKLLGLNPSADSFSDGSDQCELECKCI